jgi:hypothetical protein
MPVGGKARLSDLPLDLGPLEPGVAQNFHRAHVPHSGDLGRIGFTVRTG